VVVGRDENNVRIRRTKGGFKTKKEALDYIPTLRNEKKKDKNVTFKGLYDIWLPTHKADKSTLNCYSAAMNHFGALWSAPVNSIDVDDLQDCIDDCPRGKTTRHNMKTVCGLIYKYGVPRGYVAEKLNLAEFLKVTGETGKRKRGFTDIEVKRIKDACGKVEYADYVYCLIYLGFRLGEFLALDVSHYDKKERAFTGGFKTEAGTDRTVTVSPKIQRIINTLVDGKVTGAVFCNKATGKRFGINSFREDYYYAALEGAGIEHPKDNRLTPHTCRRTFATLMKRVTDADTKDKLELIGHTTEDMLRYYQDSNMEDLRWITDRI